MKRALLMLAALVAVAAAWVWQANRYDATLSDSPATVPASPDTVERGRALATLGNCQTCHTPRGGTPYAGGRGIPTPFGTVFAGNLTPHPEHGIGRWTSGDFWRALHHGQSRDGRLLYPAFPYNNTTQISREDSDALFHYLQSLPPADQHNRPHELGWPYSSQAALAVWRALYFSPAPYRPDATQSAEWNRGAYLVQGLAHCSACHAPRNALGANRNMLDLAGGLIPLQNWYAPSLAAPHEAGLQDWPLEQIVALFRDGRAAGAQVSGPMAEVVQHSTRHWPEADLQAMAQYLKALPRSPTPAPDTQARPAVPPAQARLGAELYQQHCAQCHGEKGEGVPGAWPPLAGNRAVTLASPANLVQVVLNGGFGPSTEGNSRPFGMPPFVLDLTDAEIAAVLTHLRTQWGHNAAPVSELDVLQLRGTAAR